MIDELPTKDSPIKNVCVIKIKIVFLIVGILLGFFGVLGWKYILPTHVVIGGPHSNMFFQDVDTSTVLNETNERLVKYIEGKWRSSVGDLVIWIQNADESGDVLVMEYKEKDIVKQVKYKIHEFTKKDGFFGILKLNVCEIGKECSGSNLIPIQINRVFNVEGTIVISYPSTLSGCIEEDAEGTCSRSFKLSHD